MMRPIEANDPFEFMPAFQGVASNKALALEAIKQSRMLISSFSRSCHIPAMWSHYAARGTGVCLGFKTAVSCGVLPETDSLAICNDLKAYPVLSSITVDSIKFVPVLYMRKRIKPSDNLDAYTKSYIAACVKNISWEYEREFRLIIREDDASYVKNGYYFTKPIMTLLDSIILGPNCSVSLTYIRQFLKTNGANNLPKNIHFCQAEYHPSNFSICTPGHDDSLEDEYGEYHRKIPAEYSIGSAYSNNDIIEIYLGNRLIYKKSE